MTNTHQDKTSMCHFEYARILGITNSTPCRYGKDCIGAHSIDEIKIKSHIIEWIKCDKTEINLGSIKQAVINSLMKGKTMISNIPYCTQIQKVHTLPFDKLLTLWFDIACHYRKLAKTLSSKRDWHDIKSLPQPIEGFHFSNEVPTFQLQDDMKPPRWTEDNVWALERTLHICPVSLHMKTERLTFNNFCCGADNCKKGVHNIEHLVCMDDLLTGKCLCIPHSVIIIERTKIEKLIKENKEQILKLNHILCAGVDEDGFQNNINKKTRDNIMTKIRTYNITNSAYLKQLNDINNSRMTHLTEQGMVPLQTRIDEINASKPEIIDIVPVKKLTKKTYTCVL